MTNATTVHLDALAAMAVNDITREIMDDGIELSYAQADDLGIAVLDWMRERLGLDIVETDEGIEAVPASLPHQRPAMLHRYECCDEFGGASIEYADSPSDAAAEYARGSEWDDAVICVSVRLSERCDTGPCVDCDQPSRWCDQDGSGVCDVHRLDWETIEVMQPQAAAVTEGRR